MAVARGASAAQVRLANEADHRAVRALYRELRPQDPELSDEASFQAFRAVLHSPQARLVVALDDGEIGATCMLACLPNFASAGRPIGVIEHVITGERFRRRGLAWAALAFALDEAWAMDCCKVFLLSGAQRVQAHRLYESVGFVGGRELGFVQKNPSGVHHD
ncbi:GNAT family N-acetyltransferase [Acidovorax sp. M2(2025)]|uniref:GNAT family N-acetyltransferase n=1 Tax=Acidovorax sp. M2(2025) TaxID=3411355 RepID=UPI003BF4BAAB